MTNTIAAHCFDKLQLCKILQGESALYFVGTDTLYTSKCVSLCVHACMHACMRVRVFVCGMYVDECVLLCG